MSQSVFSISKQRKTRLGGNHLVGACCNCRRRKKKCDGKYPTCTGCLATHSECTIVDSSTKRTIPRNYIETLELRVKELESAAHSTSNSLEMEIGYITLGAGSESRYIGDSSAYSIARAITGSIDYYSEPKIETEMNLGLHKIPFFKPSLNQANCYLSSYKDHVQCQYPFLDWDYITQIFQRVLEDSTDSTELFFVYMIFAIGSQLQTYTSDSNSSIYTKMYYNKALENIQVLVEDTTLQTVQAYLILSTFSQKMPNASSIWQTTGLAIRSAVMLGLHRKPFKKDQEELKSRVFWCAYGMERLNGIVLGRPFGISDIDIDVSLPDESLEYQVSNHVIKLRRVQSNICTFVYKPIQLINKDDIDSTRVEIMMELNNWVSTFPFKISPSSAFESIQWAKISYHNSMILLLRPVVLEVANLKEKSSQRSIEWFKVFTHSSSSICLTYKELYNNGKLGYAWVSMHCVFVAGLSFIYCLWIDRSLNVLDWKRKHLIYETISSCSNILSLFADKFKSSSVFRNSFDKLSSIVMKGFDSNEEIAGFTIGIDEYQSFKIPNDKSIRLNDGELWELIDNSSDKFLRDIFNDLENGLSIA